MADDRAISKVATQQAKTTFFTGNMQQQQIESSANEQYSLSQETTLLNRKKNQFTPKSKDKDHASQRKQPAAPLIYIANAPDTDDKSAMQATSNRKRQKDHINAAYLSPTRTPSKPSLSKSEQMLNRLLKDQLQLAYSDHENNVRSAQSYAALEHLRNSQPRLELTPSSSRHASPSRGPSSHRQSPSVSRKCSSPIAHRGYDAGSSGSEKSFGSNKSAPSHLTLGRSKSATPSRTHSPTQQRQQFPRYGSQTNSPTHSPVRDGLPSRQQHPSNGGISGTSELVKHAHINLIWAFILDAIKTAHLDRFDESDPKQWWRKLFHTLKLMHGKAKASSIAGQLMGNPLVLEAIQNKLAGMVGGQSGYIKSLPKSVQRRIKALKMLQFECTKIEAEFYEEIHKLECKFAERYSPIFKKRSEIITGKYEPTEEECDWPSDSEDEDEEEKKVEPAPAAEEAETKGIVSFWSTAFKNVDMLAGMIQDHDEPILDSLTDIKVSIITEPMGFTLDFEFDENEYFTDSVLTKHYDMRSRPDENDPFGFEGPEVVSCKGCTIHWKADKNVTVSNMKKKQKNAKTGITRTVTKTVQVESFFNFFSPPEVADVDDEEEGIDEDTEALLQADFQIGHFIRERVVPHAVLYFTGEAVDDDEEDDDDEDDEDDDEEYEEEDDPDYDPATDPSALKAKDCKQQ